MLILPENIIHPLGDTAATQRSAVVIHHLYRVTRDAPPKTMPDGADQAEAAAAAPASPSSAINNDDGQDETNENKTRLFVNANEAIYYPS